LGLVFDKVIFLTSQYFLTRFVSLGLVLNEVTFSNLNNQPGPVGGNANGSVYLHTSSLIQDRPHRSLSIIGAIRMLNKTAKRRIPRVYSANNSRLLLLSLLLAVVAVIGGCWRLLLLVVVLLL
jgi:hypothetical protein